MVTQDCDTFGPKRTWSLPPQLVPIDWSLWTIGPRPIQPPKIWSPTNLVPLNKWSLIFRLSKGTGCGNLEILGPNWLRDHLSRGTKFWGTICPWGPNLLGTICLGGRFYGGRFSRGTGSRGPCVRDQMRRSPKLTKKNKHKV